MKNEIKLVRIANLNITAVPSALVAFLLVWALLSVTALWLFNLPIWEFIIVGLIATLLHWCSGLLHQLGHANAARRTGHPMVGIRMWGALGASVYPPDEPPLPAEVHIRRALGGPTASLLVSIAALLILLLISAAGASGPTLWWLTLFVFLDNLLVFTIGALTPLGFTDGSTILYWRTKRTAQE